MLNETKAMLRDFYRPYVLDLADVLQDDGFLWTTRDREVNYCHRCWWRYSSTDLDITR